jgi:2-dehydro-3-deoxy-D-arabinonate dehydratase
MRIFRYMIEGEPTVVAECTGEQFVVVGAASTAELVAAGGATPYTLKESILGREKELLPAEVGRQLIPLEPPEVWAFGVTYKTSASEREEDAGRTGGLAAGEGGDIYARAHRGPRPETFFKATASRCVGPGEEIGIRGDSALTAPEPELAYVVGGDNAIVAYTLGNDVSAWDLERDNPLYLPQSKIYERCCALGPCLVTADEFDAMDVEITMTITRGGDVVFEGSASTSQLRRPIEYLHEYLTRYNPLPPGSVALTGTGVMTPPGFALREGDEVAIEAAPIGRLVNTARVL